ncbi:unnamed protein product [Nesidiocoris tenuis]|uniref:Uncharacterized protein n=1 Tax=Nesidiocoris tenuis TaxID=355587 RepID=A0A6H5GKX3_9HEMI|nr:unnamed protein product [Nesidiocoris tenuis]
MGTSDNKEYLCPTFFCQGGDLLKELAEGLLIGEWLPSCSSKCPERCLLVAKTANNQRTIAGVTLNLRSGVSDFGGLPCRESTHAGTLAADCASIATASNRVSTPPTTMSLFLDWYMAVTPAKHSQTVQANVNSFDWVPICVSILSKFSSGRNRQPMRLMQRNHQTHFARRGDLENLMGCKGSTTSIICHPLSMLTIFIERDTSHTNYLECITAHLL